MGGCVSDTGWLMWQNTRVGLQVTNHHRGLVEVCVTRGNASSECAGRTGGGPGTRALPRGHETLSCTSRASWPSASHAFSSLTFNHTPCRDSSLNPVCTVWANYSLALLP